MVLVTPTRFTFMALEQEAIAKIEALVHRTLEEWQKSAGYPGGRYDLELRERIVRVEEEFKHQPELMLEGFTRMDKRLEAMDRFERLRACEKIVASEGRSPSAGAQEPECILKYMRIPSTAGTRDFERSRFFHKL